MTSNSVDDVGQNQQAASFRVATGRERGYHPAAVDAFLAAARESFEQGGESLSASDVRVVSFPLVKGGYVVGEVDAALGRIEDAFAARRREQVIRDGGAEGWVIEARAQAQEILDHLARGRRRKFARTGFLTFGYRVDEVDHVAARIVRYLRDGDELTVEQLRSAAFRMQRGGYREEQVDALLDATIDVMLAVR